MKLSPELLTAYHQTHYRVLHPEGAFTLRTGLHSPELVALFKTTGRGRAAFITAWNPHSQPATKSANLLAQQHLAADLQAAGYAVIPGIGLDPRGTWEGEESFLALGLERAEALRLGCKYRQNAVVWVEADGVPQLLLVEADG